MRTILYDYHVHSLISPDSNATMESMCEQAIRLGLKELAFTEHYEYQDLGEKNAGYFSAERLALYERTLNKCKRAYENQLYIARAAELGQPHLELGHSRLLIKEMHFDFILGSVHQNDYGHIDKIDITEGNYLSVIENYYRHLLWLSQVGDFDCLAHLDMVKRHTSRRGLPDAHEQFRPIMEKILNTIIERGRGIELNVSGIRQAPKESMPGLDLLKYYREHGGEIITAGSDAHSPKDIASNFSQAYDLLTEAGFRYITTFRERKPSFHKL